MHLKGALPNTTIWRTNAWTTVEYLDNSYFTSEFMLARIGFIHVKKLFMDKAHGMEHEIEKINECKSFRYNINDMLNELNTKISQM